MRRFLFPYLLFALWPLSLKAGGSSKGGVEVCPIAFVLSDWSATLYPKGLRIHGDRGGEIYLLGSGKKEEFEDPKVVKKSDQAVTLFYPSKHATVVVSVVKNRLHFCFTSSVAQKLAWPVLGEDPSAKAIIYPDGEGLIVPLKDSFWQKQLQDKVLDTQGGGLSAPFWGYDLDQAVLNLIAHDDLRNELCFSVQEGKMTNTFVHDFKVIDRLTSSEISFALAEKDLLAPAKHYKSYLIETGCYKTLKEKIKENFEIGKLIGATHAYLFGDGRTLAALETLAALGVRRMWLGYLEPPPHALSDQSDQWDKNGKYYVDKRFIERAKELGYLIGPYDSFHTIQSLKEADCANTVFDGLYPQGAVRLEDGNRSPGFQGRGFYLSSEALVLQRPENKAIVERIDRYIAKGINSYFLDCDATGELFDDYDKAHPMTQYKDRANRLKRMDYIANTKKMVLGSETTAAWAVPVLAFAHGNFSVHNFIHWPFKKTSAYGGWYPYGRPHIFFKPVSAPLDYCKAKYNYYYQLPLLQAVFHESVIMTDHWEIPHVKLSNLVKRRALLELLYGVPSIWALDSSILKNHGTYLRNLAGFFDRLHSVIAHSPLTDFKWLSEDRSLQQVTFGNEVVLTVNFGELNCGGLPPEALCVDWLKEHKLELYVAGKTGLELFTKKISN